MARHAYLILAHGNFGQLRRLVSLLDDSRNDIFVHIDARASDFDECLFQGLCKESGLHFITPRLSVHWGGVSIMRAELELIKAATKGHYNYYHLLSGMDLPLKSQDEIHSFFDANDGKEFIQLWQMKGSTSSRFSYYTLFPEGAGNFWQNLANVIFKGMQMLVGHRINRDVEFGYGSQWFSITDELACYIVGKEDWLESVFRHTNTCDEVFLPTLLNSSPFKERLYRNEVYVANTVNDANMRLIDWSRGESVRHPWVFRESDFDLLCGTPHLFARKFDQKVDERIIDLIYNKVRQNDKTDS